jgi:ubiquinone/menaquinone biosynthesis C-methylase UbiE
MTIADIIWDIVAPVYNILRQNPVSGYFLNKEKRALQFLLKYLSSIDIDSICDLGVGRGHSLDLISTAFPNKFAVDKSISMVRYTRKRYPTTEFLVADIRDLPLKVLSFDLITCVGLVEYFPKIDPILNQIYHVLKDEGFLLITYSPKNIFTFLRLLNGHKIYSGNSTEMEGHFKNHDFEIIDMKDTLMQHQYLLKKVGN